MKRDEQIGRMILEAATGIHGDVARDVAQAWVNLAAQKQELQSRLDSLEKDAARYRWCREQAEFMYMVVDGVGVWCADEGAADRAIDASLQSQGANK